MVPIVASMHGALQDMALCSQSMTSMHAKTDALDDMMSEHRTRMQGAASLGDAQHEVRAHHASMLEALDSMDAAASEMSCMGHSH
jgi:hypothetical protein